MTDITAALGLARAVLAVQEKHGVQYPSEQVAGDLARALLSLHARCEAMAQAELEMARGSYKMRVKFTNETTWHPNCGRPAADGRGR